MKTTLKTTLLSVLTVIAFTTVNAQTNQTSPVQSHTVTLNLTNKIDISFVSGNDGPVFDFTETLHYEKGLTKDNAAEFLVRSNRPWKVTAATSSQDFTYIAPSGNASTLHPNTTMPASILSVRKNGTDKYGDLSTSGVEVAAGLRGGENKFKIDYKANPGFAYDAGQYKIDVVYTATQQ